MSTTPDTNFVTANGLVVTPAANWTDDEEPAVQIYARRSDGHSVLANPVMLECADTCYDDSIPMPADKAIVFVDNHDLQRGHAGDEGTLSHKNGALYELANVFMLAWPYGYPMLMSSYALMATVLIRPGSDTRVRSRTGKAAISFDPSNVNVA